MVEFVQKQDYSMPRQCGMFPPPPINYSKARTFAVLFQCAADIKKKVLPSELEPIDGGLDCILFIEYPESTIGPYNEMVLALNCDCNGELGFFVYNIYVNDDIALTAGREVWGFPKKMGEIVVTHIQENKKRCTLTRKDITFLDVEIELMDTPPGLDIKQILETSYFFNLKLIPDVADNSKPALRQLTGFKLKVGEMYKIIGAKVNYVKSKYSQYDICHDLLKEVTSYLGGFYLESDLILPNGRVFK